MDKDFIQKLTEIIDDQINDPNLGVNELARKMGMSYISLHRKLRSLTGKSINQFIREIRLRKAWDLLQDQSVSALEVAFRTGFGSAAYFNTAFKEHFGYPPGEARGREEREGREVVTDVGARGTVPGKDGNLDNLDTHNNNDNNDNSDKDEKKVRNVKRFRVLTVAIVATVVVLAIVSVIVLTSAILREKNAIAVLPFRNINQQDSLSVIFTNGFWLATIGSLEKVKGFNVRSAVSSGQFGNTDKTIPEIGRELDVDYILEGSLDKQGEDIKIWIQLIEAKTDGHVWKDDFQFKLGETFLQLAEIGKFAAYKLSIVLKPKEIMQMVSKCTKSAEAWNYWLQGSYNMGENHTAPEIAIPLFQKAIEADSTWADAYLSLAEALRRKMSYDPSDEYLLQSMQAIEKAMELRPGADGYIALAILYLDLGETNKSKECINKALKISPDDNWLKYPLAKANRAFGRWKKSEKAHLELYAKDSVWDSNISWLALTKQLMRNFPDATDFYNRGIMNNPDFPYFYIGLAENALKWKGDTQEARKSIEDMFNRYVWNTEHDNIAEALYYFTLIDIYDGKYEEALFELKRQFRVILWEPPYYFRPRPFMFATVYGYLINPGLERAYYDSTRIFIEDLQEKSIASKQSPKVNSCLGMAWIGLGNKEKALETAERVENLLSENPNAFSGPYAMEDVAWIYMKTGNYDKAVKILRKLLSEPGPLTVKILELDPRWAPLRERPEFRKLVARFGD